MQLGIACRDRTVFEALRDDLVAHGVDRGQVVRILHNNDASAVRRDGLVIHIEPHALFPLHGHITAAGFDCHLGDYVFTMVPNLAGRLVRIFIGCGGTLQAADAGGRHANV